MKVYLDNNILISIEDQEIGIDIFKNNTYVYSYAHIQELLELKGNLDELKKIRLKTIIDLTNNTYIFPFNNQIDIKIENPEKVILTLKMFSGLIDITRKAVNNFNIDRAKLITELHIDEKQINNYTPSEVIEYIDKVIRARLIIGFDKLIDLSGNSLRERISTIFNLLDFIGFWKDKKTEKSNLARLYDSSHTYFASYCDIFVSNDKRARNKAKVAYLFNKINTKVLSLDEYLAYKI